VRADRRAEVVWKGDLMSGSGTIVSSGSGALSDLDVNWKARTESSDGSTSPEELIAAAHASCFSMALSHGLAQAGSPAEQLDVNAVVSFEQVEGGWKIAKSALDVSGTVPGMDEAAFKEAAEEAKAGCPVSGALAGNVEITLEARLA
jgi:lipoyl-dependent peroxiredoxin